IIASVHPGKETGRLYIYACKWEAGERFPWQLGAGLQRGGSAGTAFSRSPSNRGSEYASWACLGESRDGGGRMEDYFRVSPLCNCGQPRCIRRNGYAGEESGSATATIGSDPESSDKRFRGES